MVAMVIILNTLWIPGHECEIPLCSEHLIFYRISIHCMNHTPSVVQKKTSHCTKHTQLRYVENNMITDSKCCLKFVFMQIDFRFSQRSLKGFFTTNKKGMLYMVGICVIKRPWVCFLHC